jgi:hypothetical protein
MTTHRTPLGPIRLAFGRGVLSRVVTGLWLATYLLVVGAVPVVDARDGHGVVVSHWEDANDTSCPPQHDASACQLCQLIGGSGAPAAGAAHIPPHQSDESGPPAGSRPRGPATSTAAGPSPRAPPAV